MNEIRLPCTFLNELRLTALVYVGDMIEFVMNEHGIIWHSSFTSDGSRSRVFTQFKKQVGKVIVSFARDSEKDELAATGSDLLEKLTSFEKFERFVSHFSTIHADRYGYHPASVFKRFAYLIEFSVLFYMRNPIMVKAPDAVIDIIMRELMWDDKGLFIAHGGLNWLNDSATDLMENPEYSAPIPYYFGKFAW